MQLAAARISEFLRDHKEGSLIVVSGSLSLAGLSYLQKHSLGRSVSLLVAENYRKPKSNWCRWRNNRNDLVCAKDFLERSDVTVMRHRPEEDNLMRPPAHMSMHVFLVEKEDIPVAMLAGSAPLTTSGLYRSWTNTCEVFDGSDFQSIYEGIIKLRKESEDCKQFLMRRLPKVKRN